MATKQKSKKLKHRLLNSWISSLVSISMVLIMLGTLGFILINAGRLSEYVREKIGFTVVLHDDLKNVEIIRLQKILSSTDFVKSIRYVDKETAAKELTQELGENFTGFLGYNPLYASFDIKLFAKFTNNDSLVVIEKKLTDYPQVKEVYYQKSLVSVINENVKKISLFLLTISGFMAFIFVALINNTIRISVYSQRFIINTMQMVGANHSFIRKPFIKQSLFLGIYGAIVANLLLFIGVFSYKKELEGLISINDINVLATVFAFVLIAGILISYLSTLLAVNKFLRMKFDELFY